MKFTNDKTDLLNDEGMDEMQKAYAYKLAFKCFKAVYWSNLLFTLIPLLMSSITESSYYYVIPAILLFIITNIIYVIFGVKASKLGAINPAFAKYMAKPSTIIGYVILTVIYGFTYGKKFTEEGDLFFLYAGIYLIILAGTFITLGFISKKNNKLIEEIEEE